MTAAMLFAQNKRRGHGTGWLVAKNAVIGASAGISSYITIIMGIVLFGEGAWVWGTLFVLAGIVTLFTMLFGTI